jgi:phosphopantothenoylcysteine decarboxylase / phosphopantothenate---cysteine ligase
VTTVGRLYHIISGATTAYRAPEITRALQPLATDVITLMTPGASRVISPRMLMLERGHQHVESYFDSLILPRPSDGPALIAPCSFNSLNKIAHGIADSLALSIVADLIGRGQAVVLALSLNQPLYAHPRTRQSVTTLREWSVSVIDPVAVGEELTLAPTEEIIAELSRRL